MAQQLRLFPCPIPYPDIVYSLAQVYEVINAHQDHFCLGEFLAILDEEEVCWDYGPLDEDYEDVFENKKCSVKGCNGDAVGGFSCEGCGGFYWCAGDIYDTSIYLHEDHNCDYNECCKRGHVSLEITMHEIERIFGYNNIEKKELKEQPVGFGKKIFLIQVFERDREVFLRHLSYLTGDYKIKEFGEFYRYFTWKFNEGPPLEIGQEVVVEADEYWDLIFDLVRYYYGKPIQVIILNRVSQQRYSCLLPEGVIIPHHSFSYNDTQYAVELDRSCLVTIPETFELE